MGGELALGYRIGADGADETLQKLRKLHDEIRSGTISAKDYRTEHRELTIAGRAATQEFSDMKGAIAATNPNLLEFTRTMSIFGGVANTAMSALNTINLAMLQGSNAAQEMSAANRQAAVDYNDYVRLYNSPQYGPGSPVTEAALAKYNADINEISNLTKKLGVQSVDTAISVAVSAISMAGSMSQTFIALKAIQWDLVFAGITSSAQAALAAVTWFAGAILAPIAVAVGTFYGAYYLIRALNPLYGQSMDELSNIIQNNWHVSSIEAQLIAPFVGAYLGMAKIEDDISQDLYNFVNQLINLVNTVPNAVNHAFGRIVIPTIPNVLPPGFANNGQDSFYNQAIRDLNINGINSATSPTSYGIPGQNLSNDEIKARLQDMVQSGTKTATNSDLSLSALSGIGSSLVQQNESLSSINSGIMLQSNIIEQQTAAINAGRAATHAQLIQMQASAQAAVDAAQAQVNAVSGKSYQIFQSNFAALNADPNYTIGDVPGYKEAAAAEQNASSALTAAQTKLNQVNQQIQEVGTQDLLAPYLRSVGLDPNQGLGSIVTGAIGIGGGIPSSVIDEFINTHNYGAFTKQAILDANPYGTTGGYGNAPSQQDQINAWMKSTGINDVNTARQALGYGGVVSSGSGNYSPTGGQFGGLPGQYGQPSITVNVNNEGSVLSNQNLKDVVNMSVKEALQATF